MKADSAVNYVKYHLFKKSFKRLRYINIRNKVIKDKLSILKMSKAQIFNAFVEYNKLGYVNKKTLNLRKCFRKEIIKLLTCSTISIYS